MKNKGSGSVCRITRKRIYLHVELSNVFESLLVSRGIFDPRFCFLRESSCYETGS